MRLAVTRPQERILRLRESAQARGIEVVAIPLTETEPVPFGWPGTVSRDAVDWLVFTSGTAVDTFYGRLAQLGLHVLTDARVAVVGRATAEHLERFGIACDFMASRPGAQTLFEELCEKRLQPGQTVVHPRAEKVAVEPEPILQAKDVRYIPIICYRTVPAKVDTSAVRQLTRDDFILFTAPSSVDVYHDSFGQPSALPIAIGPTTAARMNQLGWKRFITLKEARVESVLECLP
jgi:uroporphyrinogen-III synthase